MPQVTFEFGDKEVNDLIAEALRSYGYTDVRDIRIICDPGGGTPMDRGSVKLRVVATPPPRK